MASRAAGAAMVLMVAGASACILQQRPPSPSDGVAHPAAIASASFTGNKFAWPPGKVAGVSLTYDDALRSQLDIAVPALDRHHLVGTFFLTEGARSTAEAWRGLLARGHELAAHTMLHPCDGAQSWVQKGRALQDYDAARMTAELNESVGLLKSLGNARGPYTFAYPCGSTWIGQAHESYIPLVRPLFSAARGVGSGAIDPATETFDNAPAISGDKSAEELISLVEQAEKDGRWLVLMFHGVGGDYLSVSAEAHEKLLAHLESRRATIWTDTFVALSTYVQTHRPPLDAAPVR